MDAEGRARRSSCRKDAFWSQQVDVQGGHTVTTVHLWGLVDVANDSVSGQTVTLSITATPGLFARPQF